MNIKDVRQQLHGTTQAGDQLSLPAIGALSKGVVGPYENLKTRIAESTARGEAMREVTQAQVRATRDLEIQAIQMRAELIGKGMYAECVPVLAALANETNAGHQAAVQGLAAIRTVGVVECMSARKAHLGAVGQCVGDGVLTQEVASVVTTMVEEASNRDLLSIMKAADRTRETLEAHFEQAGRVMNHRNY